MVACEVKYDLIDTEDKLFSMLEELKDESLLAIDLECENNLHHYGSYISLIQISTPSKKNFIVDVISLKFIGGLKDIFEDSSVQKIFHDISFDIRILKHQFSCNPKNIFDTELAAVFLSKNDIGLGSLLKEYFGFDKQKKFQMADWTKRPLSEEMLCYAIQDTSFLVDLRNHLLDELEDKGLLPWFEEELDFLEEKVLLHKEPTYLDLKGVSKLNDVEKSILKNLFSLRDSLARKTDKPYHFIINNRRLLDIAKNPSISESFWKSLKGVHPIVKRRYKDFISAIERAKRNVEPIPRVKPLRYSQKQRDYFALLNRIREELSVETGLKSFLILNKDQMKSIVVDNNFDGLRSWQKDLISKKHP